jgi:hypothetical protein
MKHIAETEKEIIDDPTVVKVKEDRMTPAIEGSHRM